MKQMFLVLASLLIATTSYAKDCANTAFRAAKAVDAISNNSSSSKYELTSARVVKSVRSGGDNLDTIEVRMVVSDDLSSVWNVDLYSSFCVVKNVRYVTGD
jgi:hypothetical protein